MDQPTDEEYNAAVQEALRTAIFPFPMEDYNFYPRVQEQITLPPDDEHSIGVVMPSSP